MRDLSTHLEAAENGDAEREVRFALRDSHRRAVAAVRVDLGGGDAFAPPPVRGGLDIQAVGRRFDVYQSPVHQRGRVAHFGQLGLAAGLALFGLLAPALGALQLVDPVVLLADGLLRDTEHEGVEIEHRLLLLEHVDGHRQIQDKVGRDFRHAVQLLAEVDVLQLQTLDLLILRSHEICLLKAGPAGPIVGGNSF